MGLGLLLVAGACTSDSSEAATTTTASIVAGGRSAIDGLVGLCQSALESEPPDIARLAIDPSMTGQLLSIPDDLVDDASQEFFDCLGAEQAAVYLATDFIVTGVVLPDDTATCLVPAMETDGPAILEVSIRRARLETAPDDAIDTFTDAFLTCVPGRYLAVALREGNPMGYAASVDEACLDEAQTTNGTAMRIFWRMQLSTTDTPDSGILDDEQTAAIVAPLYKCIDTGNFIAADPSTGAQISATSRACIGEAAQLHGYWESKLAFRDFEQAEYEADISGCLSPEEAEIILGTPIPVDDPTASKFAAVDECWTARTEAGGRDLISALADLDDVQLGALAAELAACAGADGVAGRIASTLFGSRGLPQGSYDCLRPTTAADPAAVLAGRLSVEAGRVPTEAAGRAYLDSAKACIPLGIAGRALFVDYTAPGIVDTIDFRCVDREYDAAPDSLDAYWLGTILGGFTTAEAPSALAETAVAPLHRCVDPGRGFSAVAASVGVVISAETITCITTSTEALGLFELRIAGIEPPSDAFNQGIAECLTGDEIEAFQS